MTTKITPEEFAAQRPFQENIRAYYARKYADRMPLAFVRTFGCQQNVADSEHIKAVTLCLLN